MLIQTIDFERILDIENESTPTKSGEARAEEKEEGEPKSGTSDEARGVISERTVEEAAEKLK